MVVGIDEHLGVAGREQRLRGGRDIIDADEPGHRRLLEPFPERGARRSRWRRRALRRRRSLPIERTVQAEAIAEADGTRVHEAERGVEQPTGERVAGRGGVIGTVGALQGVSFWLPSHASP